MSLIFIYYFVNKDSNKEEKPVETEEVEEVEKEEEDDEEVEKEIERSSTTGAPLDDIDSDKFFSVMIENSPAARPQSGLQNADIVYEIETEANITRFMPIYKDNIPKSIGPVRSSRHYFLPLTESWDAPYFHFGASKYAYNKFGDLKVDHTDGTKGSGAPYYERDNSREAPHNAYLNVDKVEENKENPANPHFEFTDKMKYEGEKSDSIHLKYGDLNDVDYTYNESEKKYMRKTQGEDHYDQLTGDVISVDNIFVIEVNHKNMNTDQGHIDIDLESGGELEFHSNGVKVNGEWENKNDDLVFLDEDGKKFEIAPGNTWIEFIDPEKN